MINLGVRAVKGTSVNFLAQTSVTKTKKGRSESLWLSAVWLGIGSAQCSGLGSCPGLLPTVSLVTCEAELAYICVPDLTHSQVLKTDL